MKTLQRNRPLEDLGYLHITRQSLYLELNTDLRYAASVFINPRDGIHDRHVVIRADADQAVKDLLDTLTVWGYSWTGYRVHEDY